MLYSTATDLKLGSFTNFFLPFSFLVQKVPGLKFKGR